jgi:flagellar motor switch protein FliN/FliY
MPEETKETLEGTEEEKLESIESTETSEIAQEEETKDSETKDSEEMSPDDLMAMWEEALKEAQQGEAQQQEIKQKESPPSQPAKLEELSPDQKKPGVYPELEFILDIPLEISAEIGRTKMLIRDLLKLNQGSVIELEKFAGEPVEIYVNGKLMAKGEVVVVNDKFGVRITEIISAQERVKKLGS